MNQITSTATKKEKLLLVLLLVFGAFYLLSGIANVQLVDWDENIYGEASRQMMLRGDYLNVYINNHLFAEKPPFFFWEQVLSYKLFGINEFAARFPSAVAGLLMIVLMFHFGSRWESPKLGLIWGLVYLVSFLPSVFGKVAVIDHTFNLLIAAGAYSLYMFDQSHSSYINSQQKKEIKQSILQTYWLYLTAAGVFMGLANLTKGPLGGVIPLLAFAGYKFFNRKPGIRLLHFTYLATLSLLIALSWYLVNWITTGESFLAGFIRFQLLLFSKPMEGHEGPFFYHFLVAIFGLLPWTALLFAYRPKQVIAKSDHYRRLFPFAISWILFVLLLFSLVSTKLPHYSASIYIPLSMIVAFNLYHAINTDTRLPRWNIWLLVLSGIFLAGLFAAIPEALKQYAKVQLTEMPDISIGVIFLLASLITICFIFTGIFLRLNQLVPGLMMAAAAMMIFTQGMWKYQLPAFTEIHQKPLLQIVEKANSKPGKVVFYRMVSFAAFFYGKKPIEVLHNYKFPGNPDMLNHQQDEDVYIICDIENEHRLKETHPLVQKIEQIGRFCLFKIPEKI